MISFRDFVQAFRLVGLSPEQPVIVHAALSSVGEIRGGADTVLGALLSLSSGVLAPTFTYKTMIVPEVGPENNAMVYGTGKDQNRMAEFFRPEMASDPLMGALPEAVRLHANAYRSSHPILSFAGINVDDALEAQTIEDPFAPIGVLAAKGGLVLLIGVDHTVNSSIHYAELLAGRKQFVRWALTPQGMRECPAISGCSDGFQQAEDEIAPFTRIAQVGNAVIRAVQLQPMLDTLADLIRRKPLALLCNRGDERCMEVRRAVESAAYLPAAYLPAENIPAAEAEEEMPAVEVLDMGEGPVEASTTEMVPSEMVPSEMVPSEMVGVETLAQAENPAEEIPAEEVPADDAPPAASREGRITRPLPELHGNDETLGETN